MKKIFTLIALAAFGFGMASAQSTVDNIDTDEYPFHMNLLDEAPQAADAVVIAVGGVFPPNCDVFQACLRLPEGCKPVQDPDTDEWAVIADDYVPGLGVTLKNINNRLVNGAVFPCKGQDDLMFLNIDHTQSARSGGNGVFPEGDKDFYNITLNCADMAQGKNYATILGGPEYTVWSCKADNKIYQPVSDVKLLLYKHADGTVSAIETISANDVPAAQKGIYNLMGVKVNRAEPGQMYIIDGKKVIPTSVIER